jgi:copper chaperone CopZ
MYADHHISKVRQALLGTKGVEDVWASALDRTVEVTFDPEQTSVSALAQALSAAGYEQQAELASATPDDLSAWKRSGARMASTHPADAKMAGDFRKY